MAIFTLKDVSFTYSGSQEKALNDLTFSIEEGAFVLLCGASGCGKSTLLRLLKHSIAPAGRLDGSILYRNAAISGAEQKVLAGQIGFVFQNADSQLVSDHVYNELSFGLENLGVPAVEIASKVAEIASFFGIEHYFEKRTDQLSGGEKQLLNLASVMVTEPSVLLLDEPLSQLDPIARLDFIAQLRRVNQELGITVVIAEHNLDDIYPLCDSVYVLDGGNLLTCGTGAAAARFLFASGHPMAQALPASMRLIQMLGGTGVPADVKSARAALRRLPVMPRVKKQSGRSCSAVEPVIKCTQVTFGYQRGQPVLQDLDLVLNKGACTAVIGGNGAGKSTLLGILAGNLKQQGGKVKRFASTAAYLPQNPYHSFVKDTVEEDLQMLIRRLHLPANKLDQILEQYPFFSGVSKLMERNPLDLSGGEAQKIALLKILMTGSDLLLLDEPTKGMDAAAKQQLCFVMQTLQAQGITIVLVSHDLDFVAGCADQCILLFRGAAAAQGTSAQLFCANRFYTTAVRKITKGLIDGAVTEAAFREGNQ